MEGVVWAALIVAAALVYLASAIAKRPAQQFIQQPSGSGSEQTTPIVIGTPTPHAPSNLLPPNNMSESAYTLTFDYKDEQVRIICIPAHDSSGNPVWNYFQWTSGGYSLLSRLSGEKMVMRKSDAEIAVAERDAIRAEEQRRAMLLGGGY